MNKNMSFKVISALGRIYEKREARKKKERKKIS